MKILTLPLLLVAMSGSLLAEEKNPPPNYLKDAKIKVILKTGEVYEFSANDYAVVPRNYVTAPSKPSPPVIIEKEKIVVEEKLVIESKEKNRLRLLVGSAPTGLNIVQETSEQISIEKIREIYYGVGYERMINRTWSLGLEGMTNRSFAFSLGYDF